MHNILVINAGSSSLKYQIIDTDNEAVVAEVLGWLEAFSNANGVTVTLSLSGDADKASDALKKYFI